MFDLLQEAHKFFGVAFRSGQYHTELAHEHAHTWRHSGETRCPQEHSAKEPDRP
jgi:hypothetical protein